MALRSAPLLLLVLVVVALQESCFGSSCHSMKYFYTSISDPSQEQPHFIAVGYVDDQVFVRYHSNSQRMEPQVSWMEKVGKEDPQYWDTETQAVRVNEEWFREGLETLRSRYNQSEGLHTLQRIYGCELCADGSKRGFDQFGYEGRIFIVFDPETRTWLPSDPQAEITQRKWDADSLYNQRKKTYLEKICTEWLEKYLSYGNETLQRTEPTDSKSNLGLIICCDVAALVLMGLIAGILILLKIRQDDYKAVPRRRIEQSRGPAFLGELTSLQEIRQDDYTAVPKIRQDDYTAVPSVSSHSMKYFFSSISEPSQEQPHFVTVGYVDDQVFVHYDSNSRRMEPQVSWMEKVGKEDPQYWDRNTQKAHDHEETFRKNLEILRSRYNQSKGLHTLQRIYGCELCADGTKTGFYQLGYEGRTFITFDPETLTWVAPDPQAQITQRKWDADSEYNQGRKAYLEKTCIEWLKKFLSYRNETLQRTETPKVMVSRRTELEDGMETHVCRVDGFYPRDIDASWTRDGEEWLVDTLHGSVAPNADGTYHCWLSIQIDPKERDRYRCHVEHDGLQEPLDVALKESNLGLIISFVVHTLVLVCVIAGTLIHFKRRQRNYRAASTSNRRSRNSDQERRQGDNEAAPNQLSLAEIHQDSHKAEPTSNRRSSNSDPALHLTCYTESNSSNQERRQGDNEAAPTSNRRSSNSDPALHLTCYTESNSSNQGSN